MDIARKVRRYIFDELEIKITEAEHNRSVAEIILSSNVHEDDQTFFIDNFLRDFDIIEHADGRRLGKIEQFLGGFKNKFSFDLDAMKVSDLVEIAKVGRIDH